MKQMTCAQMGGPADCHVVMTANSADEMMAEGMKHLESTHPEMAADVKKADPASPMMTSWNEKFQKDFAAQPEM